MTKEQYYELRKELGTQDQASTSLNVDKSTISKRETGHYKITEEARLALIGAIFLKRSIAKTPLDKPPVLYKY